MRKTSAARRLRGDEDGYHSPEMCRPLRALAGFAVAALVGAGGAAAASPPTASTGPVTTIGPTSATVSGSVNPNGTATTWHVSYRTTTSYGSQTTPTNARSATSSGQGSTQSN